jgi:hypothetical protein
MDGDTEGIKVSYEISATFLKETSKFFAEVPGISGEAARLALNQVAEREGLAMLRHNIESQVAFPKGYLDQPDRLGVAQKATSNNLEVVIRARDRATSLARFAPGQSPENSRKKSIVVQVKRGRTKILKKAFLVRLNNDNIGLAIRLKPGESISNKREISTVMLSTGVYLLYGPSVDQVFKTVAQASLPEMSALVSNEFYRQFARLCRK